MYFARKCHKTTRNYRGFNDSLLFLKSSISQKVYSEITEYALTLFPDPYNLTFGMSGHIDPIKASLSVKHESNVMI